MKQTIWSFVQASPICLQAKPNRSCYPGLLWPLLVPYASWVVTTMDFIEGLPQSRLANSILVVVDKYSKFAHFIALRHPFMAFTVARTSMDNTYKLHGLPQVIIYDHDKIFTSTLWKLLFKSAGTYLHLSSAYHPQFDCQSERVNQCLETFLRCFVHA